VTENIRSGGFANLPQLNKRVDNLPHPGKSEHELDRDLRRS
jgi:hypothetical protein